MEKKLDKFHFPLFSVLLVLVGIGLVNLYSALDMWGETAMSHLFWSQLVSVGIGSLFFLVFAFLDYRIWERLTWGFFGTGLFLLILVLLIGDVRGGHRSWLGMGGFSFQPTELVKFAMIVVFAKYFADRPLPDGYGWRELFLPALLMWVPFLLVIAQKDLGGSLFFPLIFVTMAWLARIKKRTIISGLVLAGLLGFLSYQYGLKDYQKDRLKNFFDPSHDVRGSGYHLLQSKIAVGSGQFLGRGYLKGKINKLRYLPAKHTDFIFPVLAEEWGFLGCSVVLGLYLTLLVMGIQIGTRARERFGAFLSFGVVALLFWQVVINLGGVLGIMPLTGVTLPLLSYGGSSMVTLLGAMGLLLNIHMRRFLF